MILSKQIWFAVVVALALGTSACDRGLKSHQDQAPQATPAVVEKLDAAEEAEAELNATGCVFEVADPAAAPAAADVAAAPAVPAQDKLTCAGDQLVAQKKAIGEFLNALFEIKKDKSGDELAALQLKTAGAAQAYMQMDAAIAKANEAPVVMTAPYTYNR